jgi:hypothetical protein
MPKSIHTQDIYEKSNTFASFLCPPKHLLIGNANNTHKEWCIPAMRMNPRTEEGRDHGMNVCRQRKNPSLLGLECNWVRATAELIFSVYTSGRWESRRRRKKSKPYTKGNEKSLRFKITYDRTFICLRPLPPLGFWLGVDKQFVCSESGHVQSGRVLKYCIWSLGL